MAFDFINQNLSEKKLDQVKGKAAADEEEQKPDHVIRILSCDGGGVRGAVTAGFLEQLEIELLAKLSVGSDFRLNDFFDIIAGNSTGSIIAGLVAQGETATQIAARYKNLASKAFPSPTRSLDFWFMTLALNPVLAALFGVIVYFLAKGVVLSIGRCPWLMDMFKLEHAPPFQPFPIIASVGIAVLLLFMFLWITGGIMPHQWWRAKFANKGLSDSLDTAFGNKTFEDIEVLTKQPNRPFKRSLDSCVLVMPSIDLHTREVVVYKSPHIGSPNPTHAKTRLCDAVLRSTAAQTYLPIVRENKTSDHYFTDGGLWANNPSMLALAEAMKFASSSGWQNVSIRLLSIGTGAPSSKPQPLPLFVSGSIPYWGKFIVPAMLDSQGRGISHVVGELLSPRIHRFKRVDFKLAPGLSRVDNAASSNIESLHAEGTKNAQLYDSRNYVPLPQFADTASVVADVVKALL